MQETKNSGCCQQTTGGRFYYTDVSDHDLEDVPSPHNDAFIIKVQISKALVSRVLVNNCLGVSVQFKDAAKKMGIPEGVKEIKGD